jgi:hypothetical protein
MRLTWSSLRQKFCPVCFLLHLSALWEHCLDIGLALWILRTQLFTILVGFVLFESLVQVQDLLIELITASPWRIALFFALFGFVWVFPTYLSAAVLLKSDKRFLRRVAYRSTKNLKFLKTWLPCILGTLAFVILLIAIRAALGLVTTISDSVVGITSSMFHFCGYLLASMALFLGFVIFRQKIASSTIISWSERKAAVVTRPLRRVLPSLVS